MNTDIFLKDQIIIRPDNIVENPLISVIMPTFCRGDNGMLARAIESVLGQSFNDFELIIVDDGSVDNTGNVIKSYQAIDNRIVYIRHDLNSGLPALRVNEGLMLSRGKYISYQFDDDQWVPDALDKLLSAMHSYSHDCLVFGKSIISFNDEIIEVGQTFSYSKLTHSNFIANNSVLHPREFAIKHGGYDPHILMRRLCDWDLWLRWAKHEPFIYIDTVVSNVEAGMENSIGQTVPFDMDLFRVINSINRNSSLSISKLEDVQLDNLEHLTALISEEKIIGIFNSQIIPFHLKNRELMHSLNIPIRYNLTSKKKNILVTKYDYDSTINITINNFSDYLSDYINCVYIPEVQVNIKTIKDYDIIIFHRTCDSYSSNLLDESLVENKPVCFLLDDDLINIHELGDEFSYLKPNTPMHKELIYQVGKSDFVISFSPLITDSINKINLRSVELSTNIKGEYLDKEIKFNYSKTRIAFAGGGARKKEFQFLWPVLQRISNEYKNSIEFHFWGADISEFGGMESDVKTIPFTTSYEEYMNRLVESQFDIMLAPLFDEHKAKKAKSPIKYLEITAAGSIGLYSDVLPYETVKDGVTGIKVQNTQDSWYESLKYAIEMGKEKRENLNFTAKQHVRENYLSERNKFSFLSAIEASQLHSLTRHSRKLTSKPKIAYFCHSPYLGGAENHLLRHAQLIARYGFQPILCIPEQYSEYKEKIIEIAIGLEFEIAYLPFSVYTEPEEFEVQEDNVNFLNDWLIQENIGFVHSVTLIPELFLALKEMDIPLISSLYQTLSADVSQKWKEYSDVIHSDSIFYANEWTRKLDTPSRCIRSWVPDEFFNIGRSRTQGNPYLLNGKMRIIISGTVQERKGQLEAIQAIGLLKDLGIPVELHLYGYDNFYPEYINNCIKTIQSFSLQDVVVFHGFHEYPVEYLQQADILLCASTSESLPQAILEGMAAGALIVSTPAGGIGEVIIDQYTGILIKDNHFESIADGLKRAIFLKNEEFSGILKNAYNLALNECSRESVSYELLNMYNFSFRNKSNHSLNGLTSNNSISLSHENNFRFEDMVEEVDGISLMPSIISRSKKRYIVNVSRGKWCGISVVFGTHATFNQGHMEVRIYSLANTNTALRTAYISLNDLIDSEYNEIIFDVITNTIRQQFLIEFIPHFTNDKTNNKISIYEWNYRESGRFDRLYNRFKQIGGEIAGKLIYKD